MCAIHRVNGKDTGMSVSRTAMLLDFFTLNSFPCLSRMVQHQRTSSLLDNCGKHWSQHGPASTIHDPVLRSTDYDPVLRSTVYDPVLRSTVYDHVKRTRDYAE